MPRLNCLISCGHYAPGGKEADYIYRYGYWLRYDHMGLLATRHGLGEGRELLPHRTAVSMAGLGLCHPVAERRGSLPEIPNVSCDHVPAGTGMEGKKIYTYQGDNVTRTPLRLMTGVCHALFLPHLLVATGRTTHMLYPQICDRAGRLSRIPR